MAVQPAEGVDDAILLSDGPTLLAVLKATTDLVYWVDLAIVLGFSKPETERIKLDYPRAKDQKREFIDKWLNGGRASWAILVTALRDSEVEKGGAIAYMIAKDHPKTTSSVVSPSSQQPQPSATSQSRPQPSGITYEALLSKEPKKNDVFGIIRKKATDWKAFATALNVDDGFSDGLRKKGVMYTDEEKLEEVLKYWIQSQCSDVTWKKVFEVLMKLKMNNVAGELKTFLERSDIIREYKDQKDFKKFTF